MPLVRRVMVSTPQQRLPLEPRATIKTVKDGVSAANAFAPLAMAAAMAKTGQRSRVLIAERGPAQGSWELFGLRSGSSFAALFFGGWRMLPTDGTAGYTATRAVPGSIAAW
jgi:hypothetical protein